MKKLFALVALLLLISIKTNAYETPLEYWLSVTNNKDLVNWLRNECQSATNPNHCFGVGMWIAKAESNYKGGDHWYFGMVGSKDKSISRRVKSYNRYRYKADNWFFFYWDRGQLGKSHYCTSEESSNSKVGCPNGKINFDSFYSEYYKLYIDNPTIRKSLTVEKTTTIAPTQIQNIDAWDEKPKPKRICREITITVQKWEYIELTFMGRLRREIRELWANDTLKICKDI